VLFLDIQDLLQRIERIGAGALRILSVIGGLTTCVAGVLLLAVIQSMRAFREYDFAVLRALGAGKSTILAGLATEYALLGALAGFLGAALGSVGSSILLRRIAGTQEWIFDPGAFGFTIVGAAAITAVVGVVGSMSLLRAKSFEILRRH
jgi:putative ABC transport system permease protein